MQYSNQQVILDAIATEMRDAFLEVAAEPIPDAMLQLLIEMEQAEAAEAGLDAMPALFDHPGLYGLRSAASG
jgi:hypothetical protein